MRPRKVTLPSGRTIHIGTPQPAPQDLTVCTNCHRDMVIPVAWHEEDDSRWNMRRRCGNCGHTTRGVYDNATAEAYDQALDALNLRLVWDLSRLERFHMAEEADRFAAALAVDAIRPEDF